MHDQCTNCGEAKRLAARGMCSACYHRAWRAKRLPDQRQYARGTPAQRFWSYVDAAGECWLWMGAIDRWGYGSFGIDSAWGITALAHRYAYGLFFGPPPPGLHVCHTCDNPRCVRPDHLFLGTGRDNERDKIAKGRKHSQAGDLNSQARLGADGVRAIRRLAVAGMYYREIARIHHVSPDCVRNILSGKTWRSVA